MAPDSSRRRSRTASMWASTSSGLPAKGSGSPSRSVLTRSLSCWALVSVAILTSRPHTWHELSTATSAEVVHGSMRQASASRAWPRTAGLLFLLAESNGTVDDLDFDPILPGGAARHP